MSCKRVCSTFLVVLCILWFPEEFDLFGVIGWCEYCWPYCNVVFWSSLPSSVCPASNSGVGTSLSLLGPSAICSTYPLTLMLLAWYFDSSACALELSVCIGVRGCGCPGSLSVCCIDTAIFTLMKNAPSSASAADNMTAFIIWNMLRTIPLLVGMLPQFSRNICPPALLLAFASNKYDAHWGLLIPCHLLCMWVLLCPVMPCSWKFSLVGFACCDASALSARSRPPLIACARYRNTPHHTSWMNFFPALSNTSSTFAYCVILAPYVGLTCVYGWCSSLVVDRWWKLCRALAT